VAYRKSKPKRALFLHIQKTAGSSIVSLARPAYGLEEVLSHGDYLSDGQKLTLNKEDSISTKSREFSVSENGAAKYRHIHFISGHFGFDFAKPLLNERYSFTFLRNPIERILSHYYFLLTRDPQQYKTYALAQSLTLDQFLMLGLEDPSIKTRIWNNLTWQLAHGYGNSDGRNISSFSPEKMLELAIRHLGEFSYIGFAETFEKDRDHILKALGIAPPLEKIVSNANPERPTAKDLPATTLKLLKELTHLDRALYTVAWHRKNSFFEKYFKRYLR